MQPDLPACSFQDFVLLALAVHLQGAQEWTRSQASFGWITSANEGNGCAVQAGHENPINVLVALAALKTGVIRAGSEIVRADWLVLAIGQGGGRRAIPPALLAVTLPALIFWNNSAPCVMPGSSPRALAELGSDHPAFHFASAAKTF